MLQIWTPYVTTFSKSILVTDRLCLHCPRRLVIVILITSVTHSILELSPCTGWCRQIVWLDLEIFIDVGVWNRDGVFNKKQSFFQFWACWNWQWHGQRRDTSGSRVGEWRTLVRRWLVCHWKWDIASSGMCVLRCVMCSNMYVHDNCHVILYHGTNDVFALHPFGLSGQPLSFLG